MGSLEFDLGLEDSPKFDIDVPPTPSSRRTSAMSTMMSTVKSKLSGGELTEKDTSFASTYSDEGVFTVLRDFLQPDTTLSVESVIELLTARLPENAPESSEVYSMGTVFVDMAEQIPYHHPSHQKMARLLGYLGNSTKVNMKISLQGKSPIYSRYQVLREYVSEQYARPDEENPERYVNYHAFVANIQQCHVFRSNPKYAIWAMRDAFEENRDDKPRSVRDAYIMGAAQWILWNGQNLFTQIRYPGDQESSPGKLSRDGPTITLQEWRSWRDSFKAVTVEKYDSGDECKAVAVRAADMMDAFERNMSFDAC